MAGIIDGQLNSADEVINALGSLFNDTAQTIFEQDYNGFDSRLGGDGSPQLDDVEYGVTGQDIDSSNSDLDVAPLISANNQDEFNDSSVDSNIWTTSISVSGSITEGSDGLFLTNSNNSTTNIATADQVNSIDFNQSSTVFLKGSYTSNASGTCFSRILLVDDSANSVELHSPAAQTSGSFEFRIVVNPSTNQATVYSTINGTTSGSVKSITGLVDGDTWHVRFQIQSTKGSGGGIVTQTIRSFRYLENSVVSKTVEFNTKTITSVDNLILIANNDLTVGSATYYTSLDNGSTWQETDLTQIERFSSAGTQFKMKVDLTSTVDNVPVQYEWATKFGLAQT